MSDTGVLWRHVAGKPNFAWHLDPRVCEALDLEKTGREPEDFLVAEEFTPDTFPAALLERRLCRACTLVPVLLDHLAAPGPTTWVSVASSFTHAGQTHVPDAPSDRAAARLVTIAEAVGWEHGRSGPLYVAWGWAPTSAVPLVAANLPTGTSTDPVSDRERDLFWQLQAHQPDSDPSTNVTRARLVLA